jgi:hypothetical protein
MDPTLSPYGTPGAPPAQNAQLATLLRQLLGNQQNQPSSGGGAPTQAPQPGQGGGQSGGQDQGPFGNAGNVMKGLLNPPPTSILGQARTGLSNLFSPGGASPSPASPSPATAALSNGLGTYEGDIPSPANPAGPGGVMGQPSSAGFTGLTQGAGADPTGQFPTANAAGFGGGATNPAGPDAMTQALMASPAAGGTGMPTGQFPTANAAGFGGANSLSDMLML